MRIPRDPVGEVIIVRSDPRIAFRVAENQMTTPTSATGSAHPAAENFPLFLADLCDRADDAYVTPRPAACSRAATRASTIPRSQALLDYSTHRLLWSWYRRDREAGLRTQF